MTIMGSIRKWMGCQHVPLEDLNDIQPPIEVREVSHDISNTASRLQARAHLVQKEAEFLLSFVRQAQGDAKNVRLHRQ